MTAAGYPPRPRPSRSRRLAAPASEALLAGAATGFLYLVNPHAHQVFLPCPFRLLTGCYCPFCGGLRMVHDLAHGQLVAALHDDALALPLLLIAVAAWLNVAVGRWRGRPVVRVRRPGWLWPAMVVVLVAWTVLRNLPFRPFTALHP
ncbi:MAG: DUF2752 domain-containing protein [Actinobacteria bacterium]|nr:DUF2752 domain-containing protein [Actinomycetota bacterium]